MTDALPSLTPHGWALVAVAAYCVGLSKAGLGGVGLVPMLLFATVFPARASTGLLLPLLIVADITAVAAFRRHADWRQLHRVLLPAAIGIVLGWWSLGHLSDAGLRPVIGVVILALVAVQLLRDRLGSWIVEGHQSPAFAWVLGGLGGWTTMLANAAGPVMSLFFLAVRLPKLVFVGTTAWFFFIVNLSKVPFGVQLGLVTGRSVVLALLCAPLIVAGVFSGGWLVMRLPQHWFERLVLIFAVAGSIRLLLPK